MPIKYNRENKPISLDNVEDRWGIPQRSPKMLRRRLLIINAGVFMAMVLLFFYTIMSSKEDKRWLPARPGEGEVVTKSINEEGPISQYFVEISVAVPPAEPSEAEYVAEDTPERETRIGALVLSHQAQVEERAWNALEEGQMVNVMYQIDLLRTRIFVSEVMPRD